jgi:hypothetical protein
VGQAEALTESTRSFVRRIQIQSPQRPRTTKTIYGYLFPDSSEKVAAKLDAYTDLDRSRHGLVAALSGF